MYHDSEKYKLAKELKTIDYEYLLGKNTSFSPNISHNFNFRKGINKSDKNFEERQKDYLFIINKKNEELKNKLEHDQEILCSFNPQIMQDKDEYNQIKKEKNTSIPVFQRLYQDSKIRKDNQAQKERENINKFNELSRSLSQKRILNYDILNKLNENKKDEIINKVREKLDKESHITFIPNIDKNGIKEYTNEEREEIINNIINRLYYKNVNYSPDKIEND